MLGKFKLASALMIALSAPAFAADAPGVTATEIKIGGVFPSAVRRHRSASSAGSSCLRSIHQRPRRHQRPQDQLYCDG